MNNLPFFDVRNAPPSADEIQRRRRWEAPCFAALVLTPAALCILWQYIFGPSIFALFLSFITTVVGVLFAAAGYSKYETVDDAECIELVKLCAVTPEGVEYRKRVVHLKREFVRAEYQMLESWNDGKEGRAARKTLYSHN